VANKTKTKKSAFVPRVLVRTAVVGLVPACAAAVACSSGTTTSTTDGGHDAAKDAPIFSVAAVAYPAYEAGTPKDSGGTPDVFIGVAAVAYPAYEAGTG
jgi:hypothetical protein